MSVANIRQIKDNLIKVMKTSHIIYSEFKSPHILHSWCYKDFNRKKDIIIIIATTTV